MALGCQFCLMRSFAGSCFSRFGHGLRRRLLPFNHGLERFFGFPLSVCAAFEVEFSGRAVPVEDVHRDRQSAHPILVLFTHVKPVEAVEQGEFITLPRQQRLPASETLHPAVGNGGLDQHNPRPAVVEIKAPQGLLFHALNVNLKKVRCIEVELPANLSHGPDRGLCLTDITTDRLRKPLCFLPLKGA